ncbi:MAG: FAD-dependent oxidoreductase [Mycobacterium sp.]
MGTADTGEDSTTCLIAGGGPAGMTLALLLARAGINVTVMEKHADFLRDFRGDTVHASTLRLLDELGLATTFAALPHRMIDRVNVVVSGGSLSLSLQHLPGTHQHIALVPQWDFLEMLATAAATEPAFRLLRNTEVLRPWYQGGRVVGVHYRDAAGRDQRMRATLTVGCDGRASTLRTATGFLPRSFGAPMDVWWFRLPRHEDDPTGLNGRFERGQAVAMIDRGDYFQIAYLIKKGSDAVLRAEGIDSLRRRVTALVPWVADRVGSLQSFDDVKLLDVQLNRLRKWYADGILFLGDAAHAMSPVGGVGINLAIADAVAAARILAGPLQSGTLSSRHLALVQARRWLPAALIQRVQRFVHDNIISRGLASNRPADGGPPRTLRLANRFPVLTRIAAYGVAIGPLPEHAPAFARR